MESLVLVSFSLFLFLVSCLVVGILRILYRDILERWEEREGNLPPVVCWGLIFRSFFV